MNRKQKGSVPATMIGLVILVLAIASGIGYFLFYKNKPTEHFVDQNTQQQPIPREMTNEEAKQFFKATEIVSNNSPDSVKFWTEAYCPGSETNYDYSIPVGYFVFSCDATKQEKGTHGGCPTCIMSEIEVRAENTLAQNQEQNLNNRNWNGTKYYFNYLSDTSLPLFLNNLKVSSDIKIGLYYNEGGEFFNSRNMYVKQACEYHGEYIDGDCSKSFMMLNKWINQDSSYNIYSDQYSLFSKETSHTFGGSALSIKNTNNISAEYVGLKINNISLIKDLQIQFVIDAHGGYELGMRNDDIIDKILGIESVAACGPAQMVENIGSANLVLEKIENEIYWYKITKPINLKPSEDLCYTDASGLGRYGAACGLCERCHDKCSQAYTMEQEEYYACGDGCDYGQCLVWPKDSLMFNIYYSPKNISGPLQIQVANIIFKNNANNTYYAPTYGNRERLFTKYSSEFYKAYLVDGHCFVAEDQEIPADCY